MIEVAGTAPVLVTRTEATAPDSIDLRHGAGGRYAGVWVLVMHGDRPVGTLELDHPGETVEASTLRGLIAERFAGELREPPFRFPEVSALPEASVVVATSLTRPQALSAALRRLEGLDYPAYEVLVVANGPDAGRVHDLLDTSALPRTRLLAERRPGASAARNRGLAEAKGEIVAFTDDDDEVDTKWLRALASHLLEPDAGAAVGLVVPAALETAAQVWFEHSARRTRSLYVPARFRLAAPEGRFAGAASLLRPTVVRESDGSAPQRTSLYATGEFGTGSNMAFRTAFLRELGGFDESLGPGTPARSGEDLALLVAVLAEGAPLVYEPGAILSRGLRESFAELEDQLRGYGTGFTAMLTSLVWRRPRHALGLLGAVPRAPRWLRGGGDGPGGPPRPGEVRRLGRADRLGMLVGPGAYALSRLRQGRSGPSGSGRSRSGRSRSRHAA